MSVDNVLCCFCNMIIESDEFNPCDINILTNWNKPKSMQNNQTFWCHLECFKEKLHRDMKQHLVVHLLSESHLSDEKEES